MFSIVIPTWNNLAYIKVCVDSILKNSTFQHQIILHINDGNDGTLNWAKENNLTFTHSDKNIGICKALNLASEKATHQYFCYFNDDMYALPGWDFELVKEIEMIPHNLFFISSTMIEPKEGNNKNAIQGKNFGDVFNFKEKELFHSYKDFQLNDWSGSSWPPNVLPLELWKKVGGYSLEFSPGMYSDPDFSMKLWKEGVRYFKGISNSRVYHFMSKSTAKVRKNDGRGMFCKKWKMTPGFFYKKYLRMGESWKGELKNPGFSLSYLKSKIRAFFIARKHDKNLKKS